MQNDSRARQLVLFPCQLLTWETLPDEVQQSLKEVISLLLEQALDWQSLDQQDETDSDKNHDD